MIPLLLTYLFHGLAMVPQSPSLMIFGDIPRPITVTLAIGLAAMPRSKVIVQVNGREIVYEGVSMRDILTRSGLPEAGELRDEDAAKAVVVTSADGFHAVFALAEFDPSFTNRASMIAYLKNGVPLDETEGPMQLILVGERRPARWVRHVVSIEIRVLP